MTNGPSGLHTSAYLGVLFFGVLTGCSGPRFREVRLATVPEGYAGFTSLSIKDERGFSTRTCFALEKGGKLFGFDEQPVSKDNIDSPVFSADGKKVTYKAKKGDSWFIFVGDSASEAFDWVPLWPRVSLDGQQVVHEAKKGEKWLVVVGNKPGENFDMVDEVLFSPDSTKLAYKAKKGGKWAIVISDKRREEFDEIGNLVFSPDSTKLAYKAKKRGKWAIVIGDKRLEEFEEIDNLVFSPDSTKLAYRARILEQLREGPLRGALVAGWSIVVGEKRGELFREVGPPVFSPDGSKLAHQAYDAFSGWTILVDGNRGQTFDSVGSPVFSKRGDVAHWASKGKTEIGLPKQFLILNGKRDPLEFVNVQNPVFSQDGMHIAYAAFGAVPREGAKVPSSGRGVVIVDGTVKAQDFDDIGDCLNGSTLEPVVSPDGRRVAFRGKVGSKWAVVVDGIRGEEFDAVGGLVFSSDSKHVAYWARRHNKEYAVLDNRKGESFDFVGIPIFGARGQIGYGVRKGRELWWKVLE